MLVEPLLEVGGGLEVEQGFAEVVELGGCEGVKAGDGSGLSGIRFSCHQAKKRPGIMSASCLRGEIVQLSIEVEQEDGRWLSEVPELPGVLAYGQSRSEAVVRAQVLALRVPADRIEQGETLPQMRYCEALR